MSGVLPVFIIRTTSYGVNIAPSALLVGSRGKKMDGGQRLALCPETSRFAALILARKGSALPWLVDERAALQPRRIWCLLLLAR